MNYAAYVLLAFVGVVNAEWLRKPETTDGVKALSFAEDVIVAKAEVAAKARVDNEEEGGGGLKTFDRNMLPMTKEKFALVAHAMNRNDEIYQGAPNFEWAPEGVTPYTYHGGVDRMFTEEYGDDICMVTWMGTNNATGDWNQNMNQGSRYVGDGVCSVNDGLWQAYSGSGNGESADFVPVLEDFITTCHEDGKQLVFNGHSQGAGAAGIANAIFAHYNPITILFANAPWIANRFRSLDHCAPRPNEIWRFINSENGEGRILYDVVPNLMKVVNTITLGIIDVFSAGGYIIMPPGGTDGTMDPMQDSVAYYGPENPEMDVSVLNLDTNDECSMTGTTHQLPAYRKKINDLYNGIPDGGELDISGFIDGSMCHATDECQGACEVESYSNPLLRCTAKLEAGEPCNENADCLSEKCGGWNPFDWRCQV